MYANCRQLTGVILGCLLLIPLHGAWAGPAEDQFAIATGHYARQRWKLACDEFQVFLERHANHREAATATFFFAESLVQQKQYTRAAKMLDEYLMKYPEHPFTRNAIFRRGEIAYLNNDDEEAVRRLEAFRRQYPEDALNSYVLPYLGEIALRQHDLKKARDEFGEALTKYPTNSLASQCRLGMGRTLERSGDYASAERFYRFLTRDRENRLADDALLELGAMQVEQRQFDEALATLGDFAGRFPQSNLAPHAEYWRGMALQGKRKWAEAAQTLQQALAANPQHQLAPALAFAAAESLAKAGDPQAALPLYDQVLQNWPRSPWGDDSLQAKIQIALEESDAKQVEQLANRFREQYPDSELNSTVLQTLGRALLKQQRFSEAADVFRPLVSRDQPAARPADRYYLALAYLGQSRTEDALELLDHESLQGDNSLRAGVLSARATVLVQSKRYQEAIDPLREYLKSFASGSDASKCRSQLIVALAGAGRIEEAASELETLLQQQAPDAGILATAKYVADAARQRGQEDVAARCYELLIKNPTDDRNVDGLLGLGRLKLADDPAAAVELFRRIVDQHPGSQEAAEAEFLLAQSLENANRATEALDVYRNILKDRPQSPDIVRVKHQAARLHQSFRQHEEALELLQDIANTHQDYSRLDAVLYERGWALVDLKRDNEADAVFRDLADRFPASRYRAHALYRLAERAARRQDYAAAEKLLAVIVNEACDARILCHAFYLKGQVSANLGQWNLVATPMQRILDNFPRSELCLPARYWIAESRYRLEQYDQASLDFEALRTATQQRDDAWLAMIPLRLAQVRAHQGKWSEAQQLADSISSRFPEFGQQFEVDYLRGRCLLSKADFSAAREAFEKVVRSPAGGRSETAAMAQWMIGESYFQQKNHEEAIRAYHRVEVLFAFPRWQAAALLQAGKCHEVKGRWREAVKLYAQVINEYPETQFVNDASQRIRIARQHQEGAGSVE